MNLTMINGTDSKLKSKDHKMPKPKPILHLVAKRIERTLAASLAQTLTITEKKTMTMTMTLRRTSRRSAKKRARVITTIKSSPV